MNLEQGISNHEGGVTTQPPLNFFIRNPLFTIRYSTAFLIVFALCNDSHAEPLPRSAKDSNPLAAAFARVIENAIPREYEKRKDWGSTKNITVGLRADGLKIHRRKKAVKHGVWKHYRVKLVEPEKNLTVEILNLSPAENGGVRFTLALQAKFDMWARAKVYRYGVHLIALEAVGDAAIELELDCELGMQLKTHDGHAGVALDPHVLDSRLDIVDFHLRRVSNAKGPIVRELGEELPQLLEKELHGPKLVAKLNRAIEKKRDRLELSFGELWK